MSAEKPLTYLACPYSHPDPVVMAHRFDRVNRAAANLIEQGMVVYSPISHTHPIAVAGDLPDKSWAFWEQFDRAYLNLSHQLIVLCLPGWKESVGVAAEIKIAGELGIPVVYKLK